MAEYECICKYCAFADACPSAYFPPNKMKCADLRDMRKKCGQHTQTAERGGVISLYQSEKHLRLLLFYRHRHYEIHQCYQYVL